MENFIFGPVYPKDLYSYFWFVLIKACIYFINGHILIGYFLHQKSVQILILNILKKI